MNPAAIATISISPTYNNQLGRADAALRDSVIRSTPDETSSIGTSSLGVRSVSTEFSAIKAIPHAGQKRTPG
jgi:hypothetical protein